MQITEQIHALKLPFQVHTPAGMTLERFVYVYLICGQDITLIDCGVKGHEAAILGYIEQMGRKPRDIKNIILTHSHPDHVGAAAALKNAVGASVWAHAAEKPWIEDTDLQFSQRPVPGFYDLVGGSVKVDGLLENGQVLTLEDRISLQVLHTPGHSAGSISLFMPGTGALFCADAVPIPGDVPIYDDVVASLASIQKLQDVTGVNYLLSAWDEPRREGEIVEVLARAADFINRLQDIVDKHSHEVQDPLIWCQAILVDLGMPPQAANPLIIRTFKAHLLTRRTL